MGEISSLEIILGTYEQFLLGYRYYPKSQEIKQSFATHSHSSSIRSVCVSGNYLASGGADDRIFVYDLKLRKEHCILTHHNATISCLAFTPEHTHVLSGSTDGVLAIVRVGNWQLEKIWEKAHKGAAVLDVAVHSSGKLALTLGTDHTLCTWNLVKGRQAYIINLNTKSKDPKSLEHITWGPCGVRFILSGGKYTEVWSIDKGGILKAIEHTNKVICCTWISDDSLLVGYENGKLAHVDTETGKIQIYDGHNSRVKAVAKYEDYLVSAASGGDVKIWNTDMEMLAECKSGCRITCLCIASVVDSKENVKIETEPSESESDEEQEDETVNSKREIEEDSGSETVITIAPRKKIKKQRSRR